jgi:hypothetical protein
VRRLEQHRRQQLEHAVDRRGARPGRHGRRHRRPQLRADARVPRGGLLREGRRLRPAQALRQDLAKRFGATEQAHVETIRSTIAELGGKPVAEPKAKFPLDDRMSVLKLAATVENLGAAAYLGQAENISSPDVLSAALSIHSVEARHAAALNNLLGRKVTPDGAFAKPATKQEVLKAVQPFLVS